MPRRTHLVLSELKILSLAFHTSAKATPIPQTDPIISQISPYWPPSIFLKSSCPLPSLWELEDRPEGTEGRLPLAFVFAAGFRVWPSPALGLDAALRGMNKLPPVGGAPARFDAPSCPSSASSRVLSLKMIGSVRSSSLPAS